MAHAEHHISDPDVLLIVSQMAATIYAGPGKPPVRECVNIAINLYLEAVSQLRTVQDV